MSKWWESSSTALAFGILLWAGAIVVALLSHGVQWAIAIIFFIIGLLLLLRSYIIHKHNIAQIYREGSVATVAGQGILFDIELATRQAILHQLRVVVSKSCVFNVMVCENGSNLIDAMHSNIGIFYSHGRLVQETFRLPDWYYEDKDGGTHLHLEITPLLDQYLKPQTPVEFKVGVWFTSISQ
jgi:hypothetical protein